MMNLVITVIFGLVFAYFATQNTALVNVNFWEYSISSIPLYFVMIGSLFVGLIIPVMVGLIKSLSTSMKISKKEDQLKKSQEEITELTRKIHKLELENTKYKTELGREDADEDSI